MSELSFRLARHEDVWKIVEMLADDPLGAKREKFEEPLPASYLDTFAAIDSDPNNELIIAELAGEMVGFMQLTYIPYLTYQGRWRALVEGVRVDKNHRGKGIGKELFLWAIERAKQRKCHLLQLTTDKQRPDAVKFYKTLGFVASHEGMKMHF